MYSFAVGSSETSFIVICYQMATMSNQVTNMSNHVRAMSNHVTILPDHVIVISDRVTTMYSPVMSDIRSRDREAVTN